jgi:hypothetical protein
VSPPVTPHWRHRLIYWVLGTLLLAFTVIGIFKGAWVWAVPLLCYVGFLFLAPGSHQAVSDHAYREGLNLTPWPICEHGDDATICEQCWNEYTGPTLREQLRYRWNLLRARVSRKDPF